MRSFSLLALSFQTSLAYMHRFVLPLFSCGHSASSPFFLARSVASTRGVLACPYFKPNLDVGLTYSNASNDVDGPYFIGPTFIVKRNARGARRTPLRGLNDRPPGVGRSSVLDRVVACGGLFVARSACGMGLAGGHLRKAGIWGMMVATLQALAAIGEQPNQLADVFRRSHVKYMRSVAHQRVRSINFGPKEHLFERGRYRRHPSLATSAANPRHQWAARRRGPHR